MSSKLIQHRQGTSGVSAYVGDSRVRVLDIAELYEAALTDLIVERIQKSLPHLSQEEILAAIRYWHDHRPEIDSELKRDEEALQAIRSTQ